MKNEKLKMKNEEPQPSRPYGTGQALKKGAITGRDIIEYGGF